MLRRVCIDGNRFASHVLPTRRMGGRIFPQRTRGGSNRRPLEQVEQKAWMGVKIVMGLKGHLNYKCYWSKKHKLLWCPIMSGVIGRDGDGAISRCSNVMEQREQTS